jgi:hypothetical protein
MIQQIEIYIRKSGDHNFLTFHVPEELRDLFLSSLMKGQFGTEAASINFEAPVRNEWLTGDFPDHLKIKVDSITIGFGD